jgi:predicted small secreted protein
MSALSHLCYAFPMKKLLLLALACAFLTSCATMVGPRDIEIPLHKLQASLDKRFPVSSRLLELFEVELTRPQLSVLPDANRIALAMDAAIAPPFIRQSWRGSLSLSGRLYIDPARNAVLMAEPRVDQFTIDGADEARQRQLTRVANVLMDKVVGDTPLYHFRPEDLRYAGVQFTPTRVTATARGLLVSVEPAR